MDIFRESQQQVFDEIEVRVFKHYTEGFVAEVVLPDGKASCELPPPPCEALSAEAGPRAYGSRLFEWLFRDDLLKTFRDARYSTESYSRSAGPVGGLRLRLWLDRKSSDLHGLWWEALRDPSRDEPLSLDLAFSRFLRVKVAHQWSISERPLRMLLVVSNPTGLDRFHLDPINVPLEDSIISKVTGSLEEFLQVERLAGAPTPGQVWGEAKEGYHIMHILAHATVVDGRQCLILADEKGGAQPVPFEEVISALASAPGQVPRFVFLATPLTAQEQVGEALVSFAPMLVEAGVQAVVAIQAPVDPQTLHRFTDRFYNVLFRSGVIDTAMAEARTTIYEPDRWDWAYPVLYLGAPDAQLFHPLPETLQARLRTIKQTFKR